MIDAVVLFLSVLVAEFVRFGVEPVAPRGTDVTYTILGALIAAMWWVSLQFYGARDVRILGHGTEEYRRVFHASITYLTLLFVAIAIDPLLPF